MCVEHRRHHHHRACSLLHSRERNFSVQNEIPKKGVPNERKMRKKKLLYNARHLIRILLVILRIRSIIRGVRGVDGYRSGNVVIRDA